MTKACPVVLAVWNHYGTGLYGACPVMLLYGVTPACFKQESRMGGELIALRPTPFFNV